MLVTVILCAVVELECAVGGYVCTVLLLPVRYDWYKRKYDTPVLRYHIYWRIRALDQQVIVVQVVHKLFVCAVCRLFLASVFRKGLIGALKTEIVHIVMP